VFSKCLLRHGVLRVLCRSVCWFFVRAILSWCPKTWHIHIVYNILSLNIFIIYITLCSWSSGRYMNGRGNCWNIESTESKVSSCKDLVSVKNNLQTSAKRLNECLQTYQTKEREALRNQGLNEKTAASVLLKLFISGIERCHTTDAP